MYVYIYIYICFFTCIYIYTTFVYIVYIYIKIIIVCTYVIHEENIGPKSMSPICHPSSSICICSFAIHAKRKPFSLIQFLGSIGRQPLPRMCDNGCGHWCRPCATPRYHDVSCAFIWSVQVKPLILGNNWLMLRLEQTMRHLLRISNPNFKVHSYVVQTWLPSSWKRKTLYAFHVRVSEGMT